MDKDIEQLQNLWLKQESKPFQIDDLVGKFHSIEKVNKIQRIFITIMIVFVVFMMITYLSNAWYNILSIALIFLAMLTIVVPLYTLHFNRIYSGLNANNKRFIESALYILKQKMNIPRVHLLICILCIVGALNIAFFGAFTESSILTRCLAHGTTVGILLMLLKVRQYGIQLYSKQFLPLIKKLERILIKFEEDRVILNYE